MLCATGFFAQAIDFPSCEHLEVTDIHFIDDSTLNVTVANYCADCDQHVYTGINVFGENGILLAQDEWPFSHANPDNGSTKNYTIEEKVDFQLSDIKRIEMQAGLCDSMSFDPSILLDAQEENALELEVEAYPNPSNGIVHVRTDLQINQATLVTADGKQLETIVPTAHGLIVEMHTEGVYLLTLETEKGTVTKRLVVE